MSRNMIKTNQGFFDNISKSLDTEISQNIPEAKRYIATGEIDKKWLKDVRIEYLFRFAKDTFALLLCLDDDNYLCLINLNPPNDDVPPSLSEVQVSPGLVTVLGSEGYLNPHRSKTLQWEIVDKILYDTKEIEYEGHFWNDIEEFFPPVHCYILVGSVEGTEIREDKNLFYRVLCQVALTFELENNPLSSISRNVWEEVAYEEEPNKITYRNLLLSYTALTWDISYLYLYQCLEDKFACAAVRTLRERLGLAISEYELNMALYTELSWQPHDLDGIAKLIGGINPESQGLKLIQEVADSQKIERFLYSLRNDIVHETREALIPPDDNDRWEKVIAGVLYLLKDI